MKFTPKTLELLASPILTHEQRSKILLNLIDPSNPLPDFEPQCFAIIQNIAFERHNQLEKNKMLAQNRFAGISNPYSKVKIKMKTIATSKINQINRNFGDLTVIEQNGSTIKVKSRKTGKTYTHNIGRFEAGYITARTNKYTNPLHRTELHRDQDTFKVFYKQLYYSYVLLNSQNNSLEDALNFPDFLAQYESHITNAKLLLLSNNIAEDKAHYHLRVTPTTITFTTTPTAEDFILVTKK